MKYNDQVLILRTSVLHNLCVLSVLHIQDEKMDDSQTRQTDRKSERRQKKILTKIKRPGDQKRFN